MRTKMCAAVSILALAGAPAVHAQISASTWYSVVNKNSAKCADAAAAATANGTAVQQFACNGSNAQHWQLTPTDSGYYRVATQGATGQGWDVSGGATATGDGVKIQLWAYGGGTNQQWLPVAETGGSYHFVARHSGKCLDVPSASTADAVQLQQWTCNGSTAQSFTLQSSGGPTPTFTTPPRATPTATATRTPTPTATTAGGGPLANGAYRVVNKNSSKCVDDAASSTANGAVVQQFGCNGSTAQVWQFAATDSGYYRVGAQSATAQGWDITGGATATADGAKLEVWAYGGGTNQQFQPVSEGGGYYHLVARHSGKCLDVPSASTADAVQLQQWTCNGSAAQSFQVTTGTGPTPPPTATPTTPPAGHTMEIMTWVPSYSQATWMAALQANTGGTYNPRNTLTRIAGQMWQVQSNGTIVQGVADSDVQWVVNFTKANNIKFLVCVHDYTTNWDWGTAASAFGPNQATLVNSIASAVTKWGAAGADIDFEGNLAGDPNRAEYGAFIRALGTRLHGMGKELTLDAFPNIWNQPNTNWLPDWVGYVDGITSMGYDALYGGGTDWAAYRWQQDTFLAPGYKDYQFNMGMPGWVGSWGSGGLGTSALAHINELNSGSYNRLPTSIGIWDAQFNGAGWLSADVWAGLHAMRMKTGN